MDSLYRAFYSFRALADVLRTVPQVSVWDDHDIRDGWGSQLDEYDENGEMDECLKPYYEVARAAYVNHSVASGPRAAETPALTKTGPLHQQFRFGNLPGFAWDLRSARDASRRQVVDVAQMEAFFTWLEKDVADGDIAIIVSSMPLFLRNNDVAEYAGRKFAGHMNDDLRDAWASEENKVQRHQILEALMKARVERNIKPVFVSGDYHKAALSELWYFEEKPRGSWGWKPVRKVFGYEILATGLFHEGIATGMDARIFNRIEAQRVGHHMTWKLKAGEKSYAIEPYVTLSKVTPNFGALVMEDETLHLKTYLAEKIGNRAYAREYVLKSDWDKPYVEADEKDYGFKQRVLNTLMFLKRSEYFILPRLKPSSSYDLGLEIPAGPKAARGPDRYYRNKALR
jgi:hypothetical protein